ncbi:MAG TPA: response regulator transcription factor [Pyrinomonadaceae bacterium]|nr:response regulator transcription factor [Pyrinomonadaceae bacterium]
MKQIRVLIAEDHKTVRRGLKMIIEAEPDMTVVGETGDGNEAVRLALKLKPDVVVMDISMPESNGIKATADVKKAAPAIKILTLTRHTDKAYLRELMEAGVDGYVLKQSESDELLRAVRTVAGGGNYLDPAVSDKVFDIVAAKQSKQRGEIREALLSDREAEVLRLIARGYSNKEIAAQLKSSVKTIESQKAVAMQKLNIRGRNEIVNYAILQGWLRES